MIEVRNNRMVRAGFQRRALAVLVALCLALSQVNGGFIVAYAQDGDPTTFNVGTNVTAQIADGVLTLSGTGDTDDFTAETAPLAAFAAEVHALEIEEGITYLGSHLFYGLGGLEGDLTLPQSIVGFGDSVFSGPSLEESPRFTTVRNLFESGEVVQQGSEDANVEAGYTVERAVEQEIAHPETLFVPGQTGEVVCSDENASFLTAALSAGYRQAAADEPETPTQDGGGEDAESVALLDADAYTGEAPTAGVTAIYLNQASGNDDSTDGTESSPAKTLAKAASLLPNGGTVDTNCIVIVGAYERSKDEEKLPAVPFTLRGANDEATLSVPTELSNVKDPDCPLYLQADFRLEHIKVKWVNHIYGNGYNLVIGEGVVREQGSGFYLYGFGKSGFDDAANLDAHITVLSSKVERIVGYVRSTPTLACGEYKSNITVGGKASVSRIVAGSASGSIESANVNITVNGGYVATLIGGNQGYNITRSPFSGRTTINVNDGMIGSLYGAGSGRNKSIPTYRGTLGINVTGGKITSLYGSGSAAYVIKNGDVASEVDISVTGGEVGNLFAAGRGWEPEGTLGTSTSQTDEAFVGGVKQEDFGSLTGEAKIAVGGSASVGNIYASGQGYELDKRTQSNAYLNGNVTIDMSGGTVTGSIYGGGLGIATTGYEECARVVNGSKVEVTVSGGTVEGSVYGGGQIAKVEGANTTTTTSVTGVTTTSVTVSENGTVQGDVYGGGEQGLVEGSTCVNIKGGTVVGSVYGGALGTTGTVLVLGGSTVNMTGGQVDGSLYGGSKNSDDGASLSENSSAFPDLIITNLVGGTVRGNVFGGGYMGKVNGSTHMHVGKGAMAECAYYGLHEEEIPQLKAAALSVGGSMYAGGDFGGEGSSYDTITVAGTSHLYIDGTGYDTGSNDTPRSMTIGGGVFGSGASCDAGSTRLVTLRNFGAIESDGGTVTGASRTLTAIQRADRVVLLNSHVRLTGQSDAANAEASTKYSLNRIGDHGSTVAGLGDMGNGLVLQGGSTLVLESPAVELAAFRSLDENGKEVAFDAATVPVNTLLLDAGTSLHVSYTHGDSQVYGPVRGYTRLLVDESKNGYVYARISPSGGGPDGGFVGKDGSEVGYTEATGYRFWRVQGTSGSSTTVETVLTAKTLTSGEDGYGDDDYSVAKGTIDLPPADQGSQYTVKNVTISNTTLNLVEAAKSGMKSDWKTSEDNNVSGSGTSIDPNKSEQAKQAKQAKQAMKNDPMNSFGLFMKTGSGFSEQPADPGKIVSLSSMIPNDPNTVIGAQPPNGVTSDQVTPQIELYLTYYNGITASQESGTVTIELERSVNGSVKETTTVNVRIATKAADLSSQTVDLYATQSGEYTGTLTVPSGVDRTLTLTGVAGDSSLVAAKAEGSAYGKGEFAVSMQATQGDGGNGWHTSGLMTDPCDLGRFAAGSPVAIGMTDKRYDAPIKFVMKNAAGFSSKEKPDSVVLTIKDGSTGNDIKITLRINWEKSAVSSVSVGAGRQYNVAPTGKTATVSQKSALTAVYKLSGILLTNECWLELRKDDKAIAVPAGAKFTLMSGTGFYWYAATGAETDGRIDLQDFVSMSGGSNAVSIRGDATVILDLGSSAAGLSDRSYTLVPRNERAADGPGAAWTVVESNSTATLSASGGDGLARGTCEFELTLASGSDTQFFDGATAVLSLGDGKSFPEGTVFVVGDTKCYPSNGKVHVPLAGSGPWKLTMDTTETAGLSTGSYTLLAQVFPTGASAGNASALSAQEGAHFEVGQNPSYGLTVSLGAESNRVVSAGDELTFAVGYSVQNAGAGSPAVTVSAKKKEEGVYVDASGWTVSGNDALVEGSGTQTVVVTAPDPLDPGTYRLLFTLGDQTVPYNLIVSG